LAIKRSSMMVPPRIRSGARRSLAMDEAANRIGNQIFLQLARVSGDASIASVPARQSHALSYIRSSADSLSDRECCRG
jgi:hypothetical protein